MNRARIITVSAHVIVSGTVDSVTGRLRGTPTQWLEFTEVIGFHALQNTWETRKVVVNREMVVVVKEVP